MLQRSIIHCTACLQTLTCLACRWAGGLGSDARLFSCSYDGSVRRLDVSTGVFDPIQLQYAPNLHDIARSMHFCKAARSRQVWTGWVQRCCLPETFTKLIT